MRRRATQAEMFAPTAIKPVTSQARAMTLKRKPSKTSAPAPKPWHCHILAIDTAEKSGWAIWEDGTLSGSGEVDTHDSKTMAELISDMFSVSADLSLVRAMAEPRKPKVLVLEAPYGGPKGAHEVKRLIGLGMARERWLRAWKDAGEARSRVVMVQPQTWRAAVLGNMRGLERKAIRRCELLVAGSIAGRAELGDDEAAAICIGKWASYAAPVGEVIGKRAVKASVEAWQR